MPPQPSFHTPNSPEQVIQISRLALLACVFLLFCVSFPALGWPAVFGWMLLIPVVVAVWVLRVRTTVLPDGLRLRRMFSAQSLTWDQIKGVRFPKWGWARADLTDGREVSLPVVTFGRLPQLAAASGGRITDPYAAARRAAGGEARRTTEADGNAD